MTKSRDLLESCLDEMQYHSLICPELVLEIQELLAQPEQEPFRGLRLNGDSHPQEPVAWQLSSKDSSYTELRKAEPEGTDVYLYQINPLYTPPQKREPLTATQIDKIFNSQLKEYGQLCDKSDFELFASSIEKAHGIGVKDETARDVMSVLQKVIYE